MWWVCAQSLQTSNAFLPPGTQNNSGERSKISGTFVIILLKFALQQSKALVHKTNLPTHRQPNFTLLLNIAIDCRLLLRSRWLGWKSIQCLVRTYGQECFKQFPKWLIRGVCGSVFTATSWKSQISNRIFCDTTSRLKNPSRCTQQEYSHNDLKPSQISRQSKYRTCSSEGRLEARGTVLSLVDRFEI